MSNKNTILVVDDEENVCRLIETIFKKDFNVLAVHNGEAALEEIKRQDIDVVLLDQNMPDCTGIGILKDIKQYDENIPIIMITAYGKIELAVEAMKLGAKEYIEKPFDPKKIKIAVMHALEVGKLTKELEHARSELTEKYSFQNMIGKSKPMQKVYELIENIANTNISVLITGESGTGKELAARAIHYSGNYKNSPFIAINCAAIPDQLLESELFGYEKGAFSGATTTKKGKIEMADGGTLFMDEIGDMAMNAQAKLLRFLQDGRFERVGSVDTIQVNTRIISATNKDIDWLIEENRFREDLYFRINGIQIELPALNRRKDDILLLTNHIIEKCNLDYGKKIKGIEPKALQQLLNYDWPGNIRELENTIKSSMVLSQGELLEFASLPKKVKGCMVSEPYCNCNDEDLSFDLEIESMEKSLIKDALERSQNNRTHAAGILQISLRKLQHKIKKYGLG
ncbi:MAG: sigma-54-dependent transcriptional regulator [Candidatus Anammoxibacter sp.]